MQLDWLLDHLTRTPSGQHGHSAHLMLDVHASWIEGTDRSEIAAIKQAMQRSPAIRHHVGTSAERARQVIQRSGNELAERERIRTQGSSRISQLLSPSQPTAL